MPESELWITRIFNDSLPGLGNAALHAVGLPSQPRPWADFIVMQIVVALLLMVVAVLLRSRLSVDRRASCSTPASWFMNSCSARAKIR